MLTRALIFSLIVSLSSLQSYGMENQPLLPHTSDTSPFILSPDANTQARQHLRASTPLREMLARRSPHEEPLLAKENRAKNIALIQSIGSYNSKAKLYALITGLLVLNAAKDLTIMSLWGINKQTPLTDLIPPNHLMPLIPCHQECWDNGNCYGNDDFGPPCISGCDLVCGDTPPTTFTPLATPSSALGGINLSAALVTGLLACYHSCQRNRKEQKLQELIKELDGLTEGDAIITPQKTSTVTTVLDHCLAQDIEQEGQREIQQEREQNIKLITSVGAYKTSAKMWAILALAFGINGIKDLVMQQLYGYDLRYPLTPLSPSNHTLLVNDCHPACVGTGCCTVGCPLWGECTLNCTNQWICDSDATSVLNNFGKTALGTSIVNAAGFLTSCFGVWHCWRNGNQTQQKLQKLIRKLDKLVANPETHL